MLSIGVTEYTQEDGTTGYSVAFTKNLPKKCINQFDFFPDNSEVEVAINKLKKLLVQHFNTVDNGPPV